MDGATFSRGQSIGADVPETIGQDAQEEITVIRALRGIKTLRAASRYGY
jgi:hypothetical protein